MRVWLLPDPLSRATAASAESTHNPSRSMKTPALSLRAALPHRARLRAGVAALTLAFAFAVTARAQAPAPVTITVSPQLPADIPGGAPNATLAQAAAFAWQEFIALNWPAANQYPAPPAVPGAPGTREAADTTKFFSDPSYTNASKPLVWHTYRGKVEIFPGSGVPPGSQALNPGQPQLVNLITGAPFAYYGYDALPVYNYQNGAIAPASGTPSAVTPWINLDEISQIGLDQIYAGVAAGNTQGPGNQILFLAKGSRAEFDYLAPLGWWATQANGQPYAPLTATQQYLLQNQISPPPGSTSYVSFPSGTIELKAAWRQLASNEDASRFYTTTARYYVNNGGTPQYVDATFALVALHIIHKTPTAPYFVFATFEQTDNITDVSGHPVEDEDGRFIGAPAASAFQPEIVSHNATPGGFQTFTPTQSDLRAPLGQLYFQNTPDSGLVEGTIAVNHRKHPILRDVVLANEAAHAAIASYVQTNLPGTKSPWLYYKLINVQSVPLGGKIPGHDYTKADAATFYQANSVVETDYDLQVFSGRFYPVQTAELGNQPYAALSNTITDFNPDGTPFANVIYSPGQGFQGQTAYNMGGCMGCHGNAQHAGSDFSFLLLGGQVQAPDAVAGGNGGFTSKLLGSVAPARAVHPKSGAASPNNKYPRKSSH